MPASSRFAAGAADDRVGEAFGEISDECFAGELPEAAVA